MMIEDFVLRKWKMIFRELWISGKLRRKEIEKDKKFIKIKKLIDERRNLFEINKNPMFKFQWKVLRSFAILIFVLAASFLFYCWIMGNIKRHDLSPRRLKRELNHGKSRERFSFPDDYHAVGILQLPYGNIVEPFEVWYSEKNKMSRIDYYEGLSYYDYH